VKAGSPLNLNSGDATEQGRIKGFTGSSSRNSTLDQSVQHQELMTSVSPGTVYGSTPIRITTFVSIVVRSRHQAAYLIGGGVL
jgi:hypothetical protein